MASFAIEARNLTKSFREVRAVDDLTILVEEGDVVALLGPNGAGKTTTLMMLLGIIEPDAGMVRLLDHPLPEERSAALVRTNFTASYVSLPGDLRVKHYLWVFADPTAFHVPEQGRRSSCFECRISTIGRRRTCRAVSERWSAWPRR